LLGKSSTNIKPKFHFNCGNLEIPFNRLETGITGDWRDDRENPPEYYLVPEIYWD